MNPTIGGAYAPGQIDLYLDDLNADFYAGNFHKWAYATRGCALLWTNPKYHKIMEPPTTSHLYKVKGFTVRPIGPRFFKILKSPKFLSLNRPWTAGFSPCIPD